MTRDGRSTTGVMLQCCLNGSRDRSEHRRLPVTPAEIATAAVDAVAAGAQDLHVHPKATDGLLATFGPLPRRSQHRANIAKATLNWLRDGGYPQAPGALQAVDLRLWEWS